MFDKWFQWFPPNLPKSMAWDNSIAALLDIATSYDDLMMVQTGSDDGVIDKIKNMRSVPIQQTTSQRPLSTGSKLLWIQGSILVIPQHPC
jgi:hypothetical protein